MAPVVDPDKLPDPDEEENFLLLSRTIEERLREASAEFIRNNSHYPAAPLLGALHKKGIYTIPASALRRTLAAAGDEDGAFRVLLMDPSGDISEWQE